MANPLLIPLLIVGSGVALAFLGGPKTTTVPAPNGGGGTPTGGGGGLPDGLPGGGQDVQALLEEYRRVKLQSERDLSSLNSNDVATLAVKLGFALRTAEAEEMHALAARLAEMEEARPEEQQTLMAGYPRFGQADRFSLFHARQRQPREEDIRVSDLPPDVLYRQWQDAIRRFGPYSQRAQWLRSRWEDVVQGRTLYGPSPNPQFMQTSVGQRIPAPFDPSQLPTDPDTLYQIWRREAELKRLPQASIDRLAVLLQEASRRARRERQAEPAPPPRQGYSVSRLPPRVAARVERLLNPNIYASPEELLQTAEILKKYGFPTEVARLERRARELGASIGRSYAYPHVGQATGWGVQIADFLTGEQKRFLGPGGQGCVILPLHFLNPARTTRWWVSEVTDIPRKIPRGAVVDVIGRTLRVDVIGGNDENGVPVVHFIPNPVGEFVNDHTFVMIRHRYPDGSFYDGWVDTACSGQVVWSNERR